MLTYSPSVCLLYKLERSLPPLVVFVFFIRDAILIALYWITANWVRITGVPIN
jgi:hypothetical protein